MLERALQAVLTGHLGYEKHDASGNNSGNSRNGVTRKTLKGDFGEMELETPRTAKARSRLWWWTVSDAVDGHRGSNQLRPDVPRRNRRRCIANGIDQ